MPGKAPLTSAGDRLVTWLGPSIYTHPGDSEEKPAPEAFGSHSQSVSWIWGVVTVTGSFALSPLQLHME